VQTSRAVYEAFLVRARETGEQEQLDTKNIRIISRAETPLKRSSPPSSVVVALAALVLGAAAGSGIVLLRLPYGEAAPGGGARRSLRALTEAKAKAIWRAAMASGSMGTRSIPVLAVLPHVDISFGLNAAGDPGSRFAAEIRKVFAAVRSQGGHGNPSILVVASDDEDDTAAVALTLAAVAAPTQHVLLIDADLERRTLSALDADGGEAGLVDVATGRRALADVIVRDRDTNINLVPFVAPNSRRDRPISDADVRQAFSAMFLLLAGWTACHEPRRLKFLIGPALVATLFWCALSVVTSWEPMLAARRLAFALVLLGIAAMVLLTPRNLRHFADLMAVVALIVLGACYLGVFALPQLAVHQVTDFLEPEHAGE